MLFTLINLIRDFLVNVSCHVHFLFFVLSVILVIVCYCRLCSFFCMLCEDNDVLHILHWRLVCEYVMSFVFFLYCQVTVYYKSSFLLLILPRSTKEERERFRFRYDYIIFSSSRSVMKNLKRCLQYFLQIPGFFHAGFKTTMNDV